MVLGCDTLWTISPFTPPPQKQQFIKNQKSKIKKIKTILACAWH
jgi:hypothetical protein